MDRPESIIITAAAAAIDLADCQSRIFLLSSRLLWWPDKCRTSSCSVSNHIEQKQQLYLPPLSGVFITFRCTEHRCFSRCAFCLNMATQSRQANGFSPVCTRRWVFRFQDMPNCFPQYSHRYSRNEVGRFPPLPPPAPLSGPVPELLDPDLVLWSRILLPASSGFPFSFFMKLAFGGRVLKIVPPPGRERACGGQG